MNFQRLKFQDYKRYFDQTEVEVSQPFVEICLGCKHFSLGYQETFKQILLKLNKNKTSPLPLCFQKPQELQDISIKIQYLKQIFILLDPFKVNRIDGCQLYCILVLLAKGEIQQILGSRSSSLVYVDIFGFEKTGEIKEMEFQFMLDSFFRAISKCIIVKKKSINQIEKCRLSKQSIQNFSKVLFMNHKILTKEKFIEYRELTDNLSIISSCGTL